MLIPNKFFEYIHHIGCEVNLHSITNSGLMAGGQNLSKRQTVFFTSVDPMNKEHKDPQELDLTKTHVLHRTKKWKRHKDTVYWVDIQLAQRKRIEVLSNKIERNHLVRYTPSLLHLESNCDEI